MQIFFFFFSRRDVESSSLGIGLEIWNLEFSFHSRLGLGDADTGVTWNSVNSIRFDGKVAVPFPHGIFWGWFRGDFPLLCFLVFFPHGCQRLEKVHLFPKKIPTKLLQLKSIFFGGGVGLFLVFG